MDNKKIALQAIQLRGWKNGQLVDLVTAALEDQPIEQYIDANALAKLVKG